jgi:hypothetical protein
MSGPNRMSMTSSTAMSGSTSPRSQARSHSWVMAARRPARKYARKYGAPAGSPTQAATSWAKMRPRGLA